MARGPLGGSIGYSGGFAAAMAIGLLVACWGGPRRPGDVLLITVDTLRPDHLGLYGYRRETSSEIDRWFQEAAVFERAYTTSAHTPPSVVSILTGQLPQDHGVRLFYQLLPAGALLVPERLPEVYQTAAFVSNVVLTDEALGIASRFDHYDDFVDEQEPHRRVYERNARRTTDAALQWLSEQRDPQRPLFLWLHYIDPHGPYAPPAEVIGSFRHEGHVPVQSHRIAEYQREEGVEDALDYVDRYDEEIAYLDVQVGRLLDGYAGRRDPGEALIVFAADHGESMIEHERWFTHGYQVYEEIARVPLAIRGPDVEGGTRLELASLVDVAPTILRFAGVAAPDLPGRPLQRDAGRERDGRTVFVEGGGRSSHLRAAVQGSRKWVAKVGAGEREPTPHAFFDLGNDPGETASGTWAPDGSAGGAQELLRLVERDPHPDGHPLRYRRGRQIRWPKVAPRADREALERLRALGYVD